MPTFKAEDAWRSVGRDRAGSAIRLHCSLHSKEPQNTQRACQVVPFPPDPLLCQSSGMTSVAARQVDKAVSTALVVGMVVAIPVALLAYVAPGFVGALRDGASSGEALATLVISDPEDWELVPLFLLGAVLIGALTAIVASLVWLKVTAHGSDRTARLVAACAAAAIPVAALLIISNWHLVVLPSLAAGVITFMAIPRLCRVASTRSDVLSQ